MSEVYITFLNHVFLQALLNSSAKSNKKKKKKTGAEEPMEVETVA